MSEEPREVPIHLQERRSWDEIAQRLRALLDECVPQVLDSDYVTYGQDVQNCMELALGAMVEAHTQLEQAKAALDSATETLTNALKEAPYYLKTAAAIGGMPILLELPEPFQGQKEP